MPDQPDTVTSAAKPVAKYKVMVADDHKLFRDGLVATLKVIKTVAYITQAANGDEVMALLKEGDVHCNIIFMDINMPGKDGITTTREVMQQYPKIKIIGLSMHDDQQHIVDMFEAGASAYILKNTDKQEIAEAMDAVMAGKHFYGKQVTGALVDGALENMRIREKTLAEIQLLPNEIAVLELIYRELTTKEIAERLNLSPRTIDGYRQSLLQKTKTTTIAGLIKFAIKNGFTKDL